MPGGTAWQRWAGTEGAAFPFWSPDSHSVGFFNDGKLRKVEATGGPAQALCEALIPRGGTWNRDGVILLEASNADPLVRVSAAGGAPVPATKFEAGENTHRWPQFLPDGKHFLFFVRGAKPDSNGIYVGAREACRLAPLKRWALPGRRFVGSLDKCLGVRKCRECKVRRDPAIEKSTSAKSPCRK